MLVSRHSLWASRPLSAIRSLTAFPFLPANQLPTKPNRKKGITEIRGPYYAPVTRTYLDELLSDWGEYVDGVKCVHISSHALERMVIRV